MEAVEVEEVAEEVMEAVAEADPETAVVVAADSAVDEAVAEEIEDNFENLLKRRILFTSTLFHLFSSVYTFLSFPLHWVVY